METRTWHGKGKSTEKMVSILRDAEVRISQRETVGDICGDIGISEQTSYKWRREYGGLKIDQVKRLKELERENERLQMRDKLILMECGPSPH